MSQPNELSCSDCQFRHLAVHTKSGGVCSQPIRHSETYVTNKRWQHLSASLFWLVFSPCTYFRVCLSLMSSEKSSYWPCFSLY
jgi:hypothetical protein